MILECIECGRKMDSNFISKDTEISHKCHRCLNKRCKECGSRDVEIGWKVASCGACNHKWGIK